MVITTKTPDLSSTDKSYANNTESTVVNSFMLCDRSHNL